jgi:metacaspase-1
MCFKKISEWLKPDPTVPIVPGKHEALMFAINDYQGSSNDLRGCLNDQDNIIENILSKYYPEFNIHRYRDREVTKRQFKDVLAQCVDALDENDSLFVHYSGHGTYGVDPYHREEDGYSEALYLYDGTVWDYEIADIMSRVPQNALVIMAFDSCHSGGSATRYKRKRKNNNYLKNRYIQTQEIKPGIKHRKSVLRDVAINRNFIFYAGCQEDQYSADAFIEGQYCGAFTWAWVKSFAKYKTYQQWCDNTVYLLKDFEQVPLIIGPQLDRKVFT